MRAELVHQPGAVGFRSANAVAEPDGNLAVGVAFGVRYKTSRSRCDRGKSPVDREEPDQYDAPSF